MKSRTALGLVVAVFAVAAVALTGCGGGDSEQAQQAFEQTGGSTTMPEGHPDISGSMGAGAQVPNSIAGIAWSVPENWMQGEERRMRAATYMIAPADGDSESAECGVFYFGPNQGGGIQANIDRWIAQFDQPDGGDPKAAAKTHETEVAGMPCHFVETTGTYTGAMGPMAGQMEPKEGFKLMAAIVEGPEGAVFFKLTGPEKTVESARAEFDSMVKSVMKTQG